MDIYVSQLVPSLQSDTLQAKINDFNEHIQKWGSENGITIINPDPVLRLASGDIDEACYHAYGQHQRSILIRLGATRLLRAMADQCIPLHGHINRDNLRKHLQSHNVHKHANKQTHRGSGHPSTPPSTPDGQQRLDKGWATPRQLRSHPQARPLLQSSQSPSLTWESRKARQGSGSFRAFSRSHLSRFAPSPVRPGSFRAHSRSSLFVSLLFLITPG